MTHIIARTQLAAASFAALHAEDRWEFVPPESAHRLRGLSQGAHIVVVDLSPIAIPEEMWEQLAILEHFGANIEHFVTTNSGAEKRP